MLIVIAQSQYPQPACAAPPPKKKKKKKCKKARWLSEEALQIAEERREAEGKGKYIPN